MPQKQSYRRSSRAGWTTVIRCCLASLMTDSSDQKPSGTLQRAWCQELVARTTSHHASLATATLAPGQAARGIQTLTYKAVLPSYLAGDCQLVTATGCRQLRSSDIPTLWSSARPRVSATSASGALQRGSGNDFHRR